jgi:Zn-dependent protease
LQTVREGIGTFHIFGVPVRFHFTFLLLLIFFVISGAESAESIASYFAYAVAIVASVLLHELGHAMAGRVFGLRTLDVVLFPIGGLSRLERAPRPRQEFCIALAGPLVNLLIAASLLGVLAYLHKLTGFLSFVEPRDSNLLERIALGNLILAVFNLLPAAPMDGGRLLRSFLSGFQPEEIATRTASLAGRLLACGIGLTGLFTTNYILVFVACFVYLGAAQEGAAAMGRHLTHGIPVRAAMVTEYRTLSHVDTVRDAANMLVATSQQDFPVVHGDQVVGLLQRNALLRAMAMDGLDTYVAGIMDRDYPTISPDVDLAEVLPAMAAAGSCALVMQGERLLGLLTSENLSRFVLLRRFGMQPGEAPV